MTKRDRRSELYVLCTLIAVCAVCYTIAQVELIDPLMLYFFTSFLYVGAMVVIFARTVLYRPQALSLFHLYALMTSIFFSSKAFVAWDDGIVWDAETGSYILTLVLSQIGLLAAWVGERWVQAHFGTASLLDSVRKIARAADQRAVKTSFLLLLAIQGIAQLVLYQSGLFMSQVGVADVDRSYSVVSLGMVYPSIRVVTVMLAAILAFRSGGRWSRFARLVVAAEVLLAFLSGRTSLTQTLILLLLVTVLLYGGTRHLRRYLLWSVLTILIGVGLAWPVYQHVRQIATAYFSDNPFEDKLGAFRDVVLPEAIDTFEVQSIYVPDSDYRANLTQRLGGGDFPAAIIDALSDGTPYLRGEALGTALTNLVPRVFMTDKQDANEEEAVVQHFGLNTYDQASSLLGFALADFGLPGIIVYLFVFGAILRFAELALTGNRPVVLNLAMFGMVFPLSIVVETDITNIGATLRLWIPLLMIGALMFRAQRRRRTAPEPAAASIGNT